MKFIQFLQVLFLIISGQKTLLAQQNSTNWEIVKEKLYTISYPKSHWIRRIDSLTGAPFLITTTETNNKPYDRDLIQLRILENDDKLYGDLDTYADECKEITDLLLAVRIKKGQLEYHEKVSSNKYGKIKRRIKERRFFINQKVYELIFDANEVIYEKIIGQVDSIFDTFLPTDFAAASTEKWLIQNKDTYSITYPSNWIVNEIPPQHVDFMVNKPQRSNDTGYWDNIYIVVNTFKETNPTLDNFAQRATEQLRMTLKNVKINQSARKKSDKFVFQEVNSEGILGKNEVKIKQWHIVKGRKAYTITYTARINNFDESVDVVQQIFESFSFN